MKMGGAPAEETEGAPRVFTLVLIACFRYEKRRFHLENKHRKFGHLNIKKPF